ncbi:D-alanyl-D-alanine carboxypeptidase [[Clostridium] sordellii]|uniref:M15 family metallopeptidase n=1 Tax=Paraclostridium sordellii TaxID=1505 RepID=UPI0005DE54E7|nr:M15 family metallopeptidase [Paeniclostridium sordellii]MDU4415284.1 M15 family metallopeptidase [Paeniclostridium sordellii]MRZ28637.1 D-alanyl-D-alanine carboxypeptidase family protein [Paeniclostridium sordellii]CEN23596.1 D-alanyl-D-alanine carboxypeptidase [[Clostridium] sordellii] [Paeniclostridium sordellii]CEP94246.1 D-alanyl-D-alanine carboxypeptidase [[Clostridium] sordellii] [Paeniclostridium sordellii]CEQ07482.1 D-alanyl-D-alanine carboxypeptidase [[Clostridium] sordellii] [Paen
MKIKIIIVAGILALVAFFISLKGSNLEYNIMCNFIKPSKNVDNEVKDKNIDSNLILVNKDNPLTSNYKPKNLTKLNIPFVEDSIEEEKYMKTVGAKAIKQLFEQAKKEGIEFLGTSAYRSYQTQEETYLNRVNSVGKEEADKYVAKPGKSEHQTGLAIDVTNKDRWFVKSTKEAKWLEKNAYKLGFILRYPEDKTEITKIAYEPWHIRYVGKKVAKEIYEKEITFEEYIESKNN